MERSISVANYGNVGPIVAFKLFEHEVSISVLTGPFAMARIGDVAIRNRAFANIEWRKSCEIYPYPDRRQTVEIV